MNALLVASIVAALSPWALPRYEAVGAGDTWFIWDVKKASSQKLAFEPNMSVLSVAASKDGKRLFFTAQRAPGDWGLFVWENYSAQNSPYKKIGLDGFHGDITLSSDEKWLYFAYRVDGAPVGEHAPSRYAQIYRAALDGTDYQQVTTSAGCHLNPQHVGGRLFFVHADCGQQRELQELTAKGEGGLGLTGVVSGLKMAPDLKRALLLIRQGAGVVSVLEFDFKTRRHQTLLSQELGTVYDVAWGASVDEVLIYASGELKRWTRKTGHPVTGGAR